MSFVSIVYDESLADDKRWNTGGGKLSGSLYLKVTGDAIAGNDSVASITGSAGVRSGLAVAGSLEQPSGGHIKYVGEATMDPLVLCGSVRVTFLNETYEVYSGDICALMDGTTVPLDVQVL